MVIDPNIPGVAQGPSSTTPGTEEPGLTPEFPDDVQPVEDPAQGISERPDDWQDPTGQDMPDADEQTPLSDDRR